MAEAPNIYKNISMPIALTEILLIYLFFQWLLTSAATAYQNHPEHPPSLRKQLRRQHHLRPKHQYRYHWFKARMKRKKRRRFRKPQPLFHLTTKYKLLTFLMRAVWLLLTVGCRVEGFVCASWSQGKVLFDYIRSIFNNYSISTKPSGLPVVAYTSQVSTYPLHLARFDTDSFPIGIDTMCSCTMSNQINCFKDLKPFQPNVEGIAGSQLQATGIGTFCFKLEDDSGHLHTIMLPQSLYVPDLQRTLLCPQQWSQHDNSHGTYIKNNSEGCELVWNNGKAKKFVPLDIKTNTPIFRTAPGSFNYRAFEATFCAMDAAFANRQTVTFNNLLRSRGQPTLDPAEFLGTEQFNVLSEHDKQQFEGVSEDDVTVKTNNLTSQHVHAQAESTDPESVCPIHPTGHHKWGECSQNPLNKTEQVGILTFSPLPLDDDEAEIENDSISASDDQAELLRWHCRLNHLPFSQLLNLAENGEIPKRLAKVKTPRCAGCLFGKMTKVPWRTKSKDGNKIHQATYPGECISVDQLQSTQPGFFAQLKGRLTTRKYNSATVFVDHYSRLRFIHLMTSMSSAETIQAKEAFERFAAEHGVRIKHYHCDNGRFADNAFKLHCDANHQTISFCGVNAHFQNGIAERAIRDITDITRTTLLHAKARWPSAIHLSLWPYAMRTAVHVYNTAPVLSDATSRIEKFSGVKVGFRMKDNHTFGCPVFALQNDLAAGNKIPKWSPRARLGINLGPSPQHARNVNVILNPQTGLCSPQFHCRFDDFFETVRHSSDDMMTSSKWQQLAGFVSAGDSDVNAVPPGTTSYVRPVGRTSTESGESPGDIPEDISFHNDASDFGDNSTISPEVPVTEGATGAAAAPAPSAGVSRGGRQRVPSARMQASQQSREFFGNRDMWYMEAHSAITTEEAELQYALEHDKHLSMQERMRHPIAFHAEMMGDIMYFHQAMQQPDAGEFVKAVVKEVNGHIKQNHWKLVPRSEVPDDCDVIPSVWSMRRKRDITTNEINKYKSRLNLHGGKQVFGLNYFETFAPVVTWFAIRLMLIVAILFMLALRQIDFVQAYPQAPIETDMFMELPQGIETACGKPKDYVLKLLSNIYGQKQAGRVWNSYLVEKLGQIGFKPSLIDDCVFYRDDVIFIVYVDDGIFVSPDDQHISAAIQDIIDTGLDIEDQGHPNDYVGVAIKRLRDGSIELTQRALTDKIIEDCNLQDSYTKPVPAKVSLYLHAFKDSAPFSEADFGFSYRSVTGKLNYLAQTSRPDIMYATHQIAKYSADPRVEHGEAIVYLVRYLRKTREIGLKFKPDSTYGFECYCDADFSGNWFKLIAHLDPSTAKSRSGWVIFYAKCPIIWASKLQSQVALSTTEAEYISMSQSLRDVIPIMELLQEMRELGHPVICTEPVVYCKVFEDNSGALELARLPKLRPRTKHINVCYHHFREHVRLGLIKIHHVATDEQTADVLTKPLAQNLFCRHRAAICGA